MLESGYFTVAFATIAPVNRPGLAKTRGLPLVLARHALLVRASDGRVSEMFDRADIVSEGNVRAEAGGRVWYGSTSVILPGGDRDAALFAAIAEKDVHVRLRALRTAHREACVRAPARLGSFTCEMRVLPDSRGVRIDVDVQAPLIEGRAVSPAGG
jgi:hypothetical protein